MHEANALVQNADGLPTGCGEAPRRSNLEPTR